MRGELSKEFENEKNKKKKGFENIRGVIAQQGKLWLDSDWNAQTRAVGDWQNTAGIDAFGSKFAAVSSNNSNAFEIVSAEIEDKRVQVKIRPGRAWVKGLMVCLDAESGDDGVSRIADYFSPPSQQPQEGVKDALVLEAWQEEINGFQMPSILIEPALGGPDTTERIHVAMALKLLRLDQATDCEGIVSKLDDDPSKKGKLSVTLEPKSIDSSDLSCPTIQEGGYSGLEHSLYRIEMASPDAFKWSQFNGGLVGRGKLDLANKKLEITANLQAILGCGLESFYLEVIEYDMDLGYWRVTLGCDAKLNLEKGELFDFSNTRVSVTDIRRVNDPEDDSVFFRLWDGVGEISKFTGDPKPLTGNGINLKFTPDSSGYQAGDYWVFQVRAAGIPNPETLIENKPPFGIARYRVPLGILVWDDDRKIFRAENQIYDCRQVFNGLSDITFFQYVSGDGQEGPPNNVLPFPLIVGCSNSNNEPKSNVPVRFTAFGGGSIPNQGTEITLKTGADGLAQCEWMLGAECLQQMKAEMLDPQGDAAIKVPIIFNAKTQRCQGNCDIIINPKDDANTLVGNLPATGGKICFTSGIFNLHQPIRFVNKNNIVIEGAGPSTQISVHDSDNALIFENCNNIHISHLAGSSLSPSRGKDSIDPQIRGVLTFLNCKEVDVSDCTLSCTQKLAYQQSCLTLSGKDNEPSRGIRIQNCKFNIGSLQTGILLVNVEDVKVSNNTLDAAGIQHDLSRYVSKSRLLKNLEYRNLVMALCKSSQGIGILGTAINAGENYRRLLSRGLKFIEAKNYEIAASMLREATKANNGIVAMLSKIDNYGFSPDSVSTLKLALSNRPKASSKLRELIHTFPKAGMPADKAIVKGVREVLSENTKSVEMLSKEFETIKKAFKSDAAKEIDLNRAIVYSAVTKYNNPGFSSSAIKLVASLRRDLCVGYRGIVVGGSRGKNIQICNNTIKNMIQAIHAGVSVKDPKRTNTKCLVETVVCSNKIGLANPRWLSRQKHGIFLGNTETAFVEKNIISLDLQSVSKTQTPTSLPVGIQLFGYHGKMVLVSGNVITGVHTGVLFRTIGFLPSYNSKNSLRMISNNVVFSSTVTYDKKHSYDEAEIKFKNENNMPTS